MGQNDTPNQTPFELVPQVPGQVATPATQRKRKPRPPRSQVEQLPLPSLPTNQRCHAAIGAPGGAYVVRSPASDMGTSW